MFIVFRMLLPSDIANHNLLDYETYENWIKTFFLSKTVMKKITALNFYFHLAKTLSGVITTILKLKCQCETELRECKFCNLLCETGVNHSNKCLKDYLSCAMLLVDLQKIGEEVETSVESVDKMHIKELSSAVWRSRGDYQRLYKIISPVFSLRPIDKNQCACRFVNSVSKLCKEDGTSSIKC